MEFYRLVTVIQSLEHFVGPVDDLVPAEDFCVRVCRRPVTGLNGVDVSQRKAIAAAAHVWSNR
jgi:hypothetical protein